MSDYDHALRAIRAVCIAANRIAEQANPETAYRVAVRHILRAAEEALSEADGGSIKMSDGQLRSLLSAMNDPDISKLAADQWERLAERLAWHLADCHTALRFAKVGYPTSYGDNGTKALADFRALIPADRTIPRDYEGRKAV